jgi:hypothetical protein
MFYLLTPVLLTYNLPRSQCIAGNIDHCHPLLVPASEQARKIEHKERLNAINGYTMRISTGKLVLYIAVLVVFMFFILGNYSTDQYLITEKLLSWLPSWYTLQNFTATANR